MQPVTTAPSERLTVPTPEQFAEHLATEPLTQDEIIVRLAELDVPGIGKLTGHQARYLASVMWNRVKTHRDRTYTLAYAHGRNNHNDVCEGIR